MMVSMTTPQDTTEDQEDLIQIQLRLEEEMTQRGMDRYIRNTSRAVEGGREEDTAYGRTIMGGRLQTLTDSVRKWMTSSAEGNPSRWATAYKKVRTMSPDVIAYLTLKNVLSGITKPRTLQHVAVAIGTAIEDELRLADIRANEKQAYERILIGSAKRTSTRYRHIYANRYADNMGDEFDRWTRTERLHVGVKMIDILLQSIGLIEVSTNLDESDRGLKYVKPLPSTLEWIEKKNEVTSIMRPVYEPMVVQPRDWSTPFDGGYLSSQIKPLKMVKTKNRAYLQELADVDMPIVYEALNAIQRTPWQINSQILDVIRTLWTNGSTIGGLPPREGLPMPVKPADIETNEEARKAHRVAAAKTHLENLSIMGTRIGFNMTLDIASRYEKYRRIYFPYQMDFRGRVYAVPHLNPQGPDYQKGLLRFAHGKPLGPEGWKWLAVHGANVAGYDKASLEDRVAWVLENEDEILACARDPYENRGWATSVGGTNIDKPWQFLAFAFEWAGYVEHGESFVSKIPVAMDGSCSGIQHFSAMLRDEIGGEAVNLCPRELPADVYRLVAERVIEAAEQDSVSGTEDELKHSPDGLAYVQPGTKTLAQKWLAFGITRKVTKRSVMTLAYGSREFGFKEQLMEDILWPAKRAATRPDGTVDETKFPFSGDGFAAAAYMAKAIWRAVNQVLVKAGEAMAWLQESASLAASEELPVRWTTPVGFPVMQAYSELRAREVRTAINGKTCKLLMHEEKDKLDRRKQGQGISPNFIHSCDAAHLMLTVVRAKQEGIESFALIHDSFGTTAGDTERFFYVVREAFVEMYSELDVLANFRDELAEQLSEKKRKKLQPLPARGTLDLHGVIESRFCFA